MIVHSSAHNGDTLSSFCQSLNIGTSWVVGCMVDYDILAGCLSPFPTVLPLLEVLLGNNFACLHFVVASLNECALSALLAFHSRQNAD